MIHFKMWRRGEVVKDLLWGYANAVSTVCVKNDEVSAIRALSFSLASFVFVFVSRSLLSRLLICITSTDPPHHSPAKTDIHFSNEWTWAGISRILSESMGRARRSQSRRCL